ncbi:hypothetical protein Gotur_028937 [Gossypium turneri]
MENVEESTNEMEEEVGKVMEQARELQEAGAGLISMISNDEQSLRLKANSLDSSIRHLRSSITTVLSQKLLDPKLADKLEEDLQTAICIITDGDAAGFLPANAQGWYLRMFLGPISVRASRKEIQLKAKEEYNSYRDRTALMFILFPLILLILRSWIWEGCLPAFPVQLYEAWLLFLNTGLALRENILRANGSDIRPWCFIHCYSFLFEIKCVDLPLGYGYRPIAHSLKLGMLTRMEETLVFGKTKLIGRKDSKLVEDRKIGIMEEWTDGMRIGVTEIRNDLRIRGFAKKRRQEESGKVSCAWIFANTYPPLRVRQRWIYHHYFAMATALVSLTWEIKGQPNCGQKQRGVELFLQWAMMQGAALLLLNRYQRRRLYTRISLGKSNSMNVARRETTGVDCQLWVLCPILFVMQGFEAYVGLLLLKTAFARVVTEWQIIFCGIILVILAVGNFINTAQTLMAKSRFKGTMKKSKSRRELY